MAITINGSGPVSGLTTLSMGGALTGVTDLSMSGGLATPSVLTVGQGIKFPANQSASSDANTLDDYEEGTWTPVLSAGTGTITSYTASGNYVKVGRLVTLVMVFNIINNGTGGAYGVIAGFPFAINIGGSGLSRIGGTTGNTCSVDLSHNSTGASVWTYSNAYPWANGANGPITITYMTN